MKVLFSNLAPVRLHHPDSTFIEVFHSLLRESDALRITVGYVSLASLEELRDLVKSHALKSVKLIMGMYYAEGITERTLKLARLISSEWQQAGLGEIRVVKPLKYHGKTYEFLREGAPISVIVGSANLSAIKPDSQTQRQYEVSAVADDPDVCQDISDLFERLWKVSQDINTITLKCVFDANLALEGDENASRLPSSDFSLYKRDVVGTEFLLPLKVPKEADKLTDEVGKFTRSNINVCYAAPRSKAKSRDWYEIQFTVPKEVREQPGYPQRGEPFYVATDDGYLFKCHTTSDNNKQFNACNDELTLGRWLKGHLVSAGFVKPVVDTQADVKRDGMITEEMLDQYGSHALALQKTKHTYLEDSGTAFPLWVLSFKQDEEVK